MEKIKKYVSVAIVFIVLYLSVEYPEFGVLLLFGAIIFGIVLFIKKMKKAKQVKSNKKNEPTVSTTSYDPFKTIYDGIFHFNIAGVSFKTAKGNRRQTMLRKMENNEKPFEEKCIFSFEKYFFNDEPAYAVIVNGVDIGNVPKDHVYIFEKYPNINVLAYEVVGGYTTDYGKKLSYGLHLKCAVTTSNGTVDQTINE